MKPWDIFISHASEDKEPFVDPLARRLKQLAVRVWYDRFVLSPGDSLTESIAEGLAKSRCGLLVISKAFIGKRWTTYEVNGLVNRFVEEQTRLIPIWLGVSRKEVAAFNPTIANLLSIRGDPEKIEECTLDILRIVRPQLYDNLSLLAASQSAKVTVETHSLSEIKIGPIRHHDLPPSMLVRIQNVWFATRDVLPLSLEETIENFQRELEPESELRAMERIIGALQIVTDKLQSNDRALRIQVFSILNQVSLGCHEQVIADIEAGRLDQKVSAETIHAWLNVVPPVTVSDVEDAGL
jgi:hypothetical protein